jgi:hypothetical protein
VFERVYVEIVGTAFQVCLVIARVFKVSTLPHTSFTFGITAGQLRSFHTAGREIRFRETAFNQLPAGGVIEVARRQRPDCVEVTRQEHDSDYIERPAKSHDAESVAEQAAGQVARQEWLASVGHNGKEIRTSRDTPSAVVGHVG